MKKTVSLILALVMCLSLCACGGGNDTPETTEATGVTNVTEATNATNAQLSKEGLIANAIKTDVMTLQSAAGANRLKAKQDYCDKPIIVTGKAISVNEEYVRICDSQASVYAYLSVDELMEVTTGKNITVVGIISELKDVEETIAGTVWKWPVYVMDIAYLIEE